MGSRPSRGYSYVLSTFFFSYETRNVQMCSALSPFSESFLSFFLNTETLFVIKNVKTLMLLSVEEENERKYFCSNLM